MEFALRIGALTGFGLALITNSFLISQFAQLNSAFHKGLKRFEKLSFLSGFGNLCAFVALNAQNYPALQTTLVFSSLALIVATFALVWDWEKRPDSSREDSLSSVRFLASAMIWFLLLFCPSVATQNLSINTQSPQWLNNIHVSTAVCGEGLALIGFCVSLLYLWNYHSLKSGTLTKKIFLPSLKSLDTILQKSNIFGLVFMTTTLITGVTIVTLRNETLPLKEGKFLWAIAVWIWYVSSIVGRETWGWKGRKAAILSLCGMALLSCALFGTAWSFRP